VRPINTSKTKINSQREIPLEKNAFVVDFFLALEKGKICDWTDSEKIGFDLLQEKLIKRSSDSIAPISHAHYSSLMIYKNNHKFQIYSGANIDPSNKKDFANPLMRNCAEKQAYLAALKLDNLDLDKVAFIFLYRKAAPGQVFASEKLIPCKDCYQNFITKLQANKGKLVLVLGDDNERNFVTKDAPSADQVNQINNGTKKYYAIIPDFAMPFLMIEKQLGARVNSI
jgi:cytidine deaminase